MGFILTNGTDYISRKKDGRIISTNELNLATMFDTEKKAWNVLSCLPRDYKGKGYTPKRVGSEPEPVKRAEEIQRIRPDEGVHFPPHSVEWLEQFKQNLVIVDKTLGSLRKMYATVYEDLTTAGDEIEDLEHAMELIKPNAARAFYFEDEMRKTRQKRRACKDAMMLIELVMKFGLDDWGSGQLEVALDRLENRKYLPKVRKDLFK